MVSAYVDCIFPILVEFLASLHCRFDLGRDNRYTMAGTQSGVWPAGWSSRASVSLAVVPGTSTSNSLAYVRVLEEELTRAFL